MSDVPPWGDRPSSIAAMYNPALLAVVCASATYGFVYRASAPMPWELTFLAAPLALDAETRRRFPKTSSAYFTKWVAENTATLAQFPDRARILVPHVREGLRLGLSSGLLALDEQGLLSTTIGGSIPRRTSSQLREVRTIAQRAGEFFVQAGSPAGAFSLLGVRP